MNVLFPFCLLPRRQQKAKPVDFQVSGSLASHLKNYFSVLIPVGVLPIVKTASLSSQVIVPGCFHQSGFRDTGIKIIGK